MYIHHYNQGTDLASLFPIDYCTGHQGRDIETEFPFLIHNNGHRRLKEKNISANTNILSLSFKSRDQLLFTVA
jgi:hypothetical protein